MQILKQQKYCSPTVSYTKKFVRFRELWFDEKSDVEHTDIAQYMSSFEPPSNNLAFEEFYTLTIDLANYTEEQLLNQMDKNTRYEIRRSESRDGLIYSTCAPKDLSDLEMFLGSYERNVVKNGNGPKIDIDRIKSLTKSGMLDLSTVSDIECKNLTWHLHIVKHNIARLFLSVSEFASYNSQDIKNLCGRANRFHHWIDIRRFRRMGCNTYDFGGYYMGKDDQKKIQINKFKAGFGGQITCTYNYVVAVSMLGKLALAIRKLMQRKH